MKLFLRCLLILLAVGGGSQLMGQSNNQSSDPIQATRNAFNSQSDTNPLPSQNGAGPTTNPSNPDASPTPGNDANVGDDTLYRAPTKDSLESAPMMRDEGTLHMKQRPREKVVEVNSTTALPSSGIDPKFRGSLIDSVSTPIEKTAPEEKAEKDAEVSADNERFAIRHRTFHAEDESTEEKKQNVTASNPDSSATPTPSPTGSPAAKKSTAPNQ